VSSASVRSSMSTEYVLERDATLSLGDLMGFVAGLAKAGVPNDAKVYAGNRFQHPNRTDLVSVRELVVIETGPAFAEGVQDT
jgi:hypothetical protein